MRPASVHSSYSCHTPSLVSLQALKQQASLFLISLCCLVGSTLRARLLPPNLQLSVWRLLQAGVRQGRAEAPAGRHARGSGGSGRAKTPYAGHGRAWRKGRGTRGGAAAPGAPTLAAAAAWQGPRYPNPNQHGPGVQPHVHLPPMLALRAAQALDPASAGAAPEPAELAMQLQAAMLQAPGGEPAEVLQPRRSSTGDLLVRVYGRATHICIFPNCSTTTNKQSQQPCLLTLS